MTHKIGRHQDAADRTMKDIRPQTRKRHCSPLSIVLGSRRIARGRKLIVQIQVEVLKQKYPAMNIKLWKSIHTVIVLPF